MFAVARDWYNKYKLSLNTALMVTLSSVLFVYPFNQHFRFTLGVVVLSTLLLYFPRLPIILTAILSGIGIFITRIAIDCFISSNDLYTVIVYALPAFAYYLFFGIGLHVLRIRNSIRDIPTIFLKISIVDLFSNFIEISIRNDLRISDSAVILPTLAGVAIIRTILAVYSCYSLKRYGDFILEEERLIRYTQMTLLFAELKAELYYLQKASQDIEKVMERSYLLYQHLNADNTHSSDYSSLGGEALTIARDIHEIKKDYYRITSGIEDILLSSAKEKGMSLSEIFYIIEQNTTSLMKLNNKKIKISYSHADEFITTKHYTIVSILNNLIINAIEACGEEGIIKVTQSKKGTDVIFCVDDDGDGIDVSDFKLIFEAGYSTKYSAATGKMSTGLGLVHVKNLTEAMGGSIYLSSDSNTKFCVALPLAELVEQ